MRRLTILRLVVLLLAVQAPGAPAQVVDDERAIRDLLETWRRASERADPATIDRLLAPEYKLSRPNGIQAGREETMRNVRRDSAAIAARGQSGDARQNEITYTDIVVRQYGDLAVVTYHSHYKPILDREASESDYDTMRVLRRRNGDWKIVDGHGVFIAKACPVANTP
jgi:ketosteroid isomerase-like protein